MQTISTQAEQTKRGGNGWKLAAVAAGVGALGFNVYLSSRIHAVDGTANAERIALEQQITQLERRLAAREKAHQSAVSALEAELERTQRVASTQARSEAKRQGESTAKLVAEKQREQQDMFLGEIGAVRTAADENREGLDAVRTEVSGVRGEIDETRKGLAETGDVLLRTQGDIGAFAGRLDEQSARLADLTRRGERETTPFTLQRSRSLTKIGDVQVRLKDSNPSKNRYTVEILADDQLILQKDRYVNEPVELYVTGSERPYEIVVTKVEKGAVRGFLSRPVLRQVARN